MSAHARTLAMRALLVLLSGCGLTEIRDGRAAIEDTMDAAPCGATDAGATDVGGPDVGPRPTRGFWLRATPLRLEATRGERAAVEVSVIRAPGFRTPVVVSAFGLPEAATAEPIGVADDVEHLVLDVDGLAPEAPEVAFTIHGSAGGFRETLRATIRFVGPPVREE